MYTLPTAAVVLLTTVVLTTGCDEPSEDAAVAAVAGNSASPTSVEPVAMNAPQETPAATSAPQRADIEGRNRLGEETSPYLLQHEHNPVHWWPWGPEAFAAARALNRPIFLSIGYSTCYWCHVMERESFENDAIAAIMNEHFVCIKVDREERPDVDEIYMTAVQILNEGQGGWPMSVFLEPEGLRPFIAGTYFPPEDRFGRPGFPNVLNQVAGYWREQHDSIVAQAERVAQSVTEQLSGVADPVPVNDKSVERALSMLLNGYDKTHGGFGQQRKFPSPANLEFMMTAGWDLKPVRDAVTYTFDRMAMGGMYDQIGGGFHRYSVDQQWLVPHFEKMLYDNGQLASAYARAYELTKDPYYAEVLRETLDYVLREMTGDGGAFYSAQDAEVNHHEGENYIWVEDEVRAALTDAGLVDDVDFALDVYGFSKGTNFQDPHYPEGGRKNVVYLPEKPADKAAALGVEIDAFNERLARINAALYPVRMTRDQPITDDKILTAWNGLMIAGLADGGRVLGEKRYLDAAQHAVAFILAEMRSSDGALLRTYRDGTAKIGAFLEDYANFIKGLLALARATGDPTLVAEAARLTAEARDRFWEQSQGGYYDTLPDQSDLFVRVRNTYDGAIPSGNGIMVHNLLDLHRATGEERYLDDAMAAISALSNDLTSRPTASIVAMRTVKRVINDHPERIETPFVMGPGKSPVKVTASESVLRLGASTSANATVTVDIRLAKGFHINSNEPGLEFLIPLEIALVGAEGLEIDVAYPDGDPYDGPEGVTVVHHDRVQVPVTVRRTGAVEGRPKLMITYQVCTDRECLAPQTDVVPVTIVAQ